MTPTQLNFISGILEQYRDSAASAHDLIIKLNGGSRDSLEGLKYRDDFEACRAALNIIHREHQTVDDVADESTPEPANPAKNVIPTPRSSPTKWPAITEAARALDVTRVHLFRVLEGERQSRPLIARYRTWARANKHLRPRLP